MIGRVVVAAAVATALASGVAAAPAKWTVEPDMSRLDFTATQLGIPFEGRFPRFDCDIAFSPEDLAASRVVITIDMAAAETGNQERDSLLPGVEWFNVAAHPQARFEATDFQPLTDGRFEVRGRLTIRGRTREVMMPVGIDVTGDTARVYGETKINRTDFDIGTGLWANPVIVGHTVEIRFALKARRDG